MALRATDPAAPLAGTGVVVTRPAHQAKPLMDLIAAAGGRPIAFPTIEIADTADAAALDRILDRLGDYDLAVFISPNAVRQALQRLDTRGTRWPATLKLAAVGAGTARELESRGHRVDIAPQENFRSESLLTAPALQHMTGKQVVIFRGVGGRTLLADTLRERGATVNYAECYRRLRPAIDATELIARWNRNEIDIITSTSSEGLRNLCDMLAPIRDRVLATPVVVIGERQAEVCQTLGFHAGITVAADASDAAIVAAVRQWREQGKAV
jgi:uroporphyrinogen-III synthase